MSPSQTTAIIDAEVGIVGGAGGLGGNNIDY